MEIPVCPTCGNSIYIKEYEKDGCYVCAYKPNGEDGGICGKVIGCICNRCGQLLAEDRFGLRNDVYECKICGQPQWGYTEYKKSRKEFEDMFSDMMKNLQKTQDELRRKLESYKR